MSKGVIFFAVIVSLAVPGFAQDRTPSAPVARSATEKDESFELNISDRHIQERNYDAQTAVQLNEAVLRILVGVALHADVIDVRLRNVTGVVRFRGTLRRITEILNQRPSTAPRKVLQPAF